MPMLNMLEAKTNLSRLVEAVESGAETEIVIARNGKPAARLVPLQTKRVGVRIGLAKGKFTMPDDIDGANDSIAEMFGVAPE